jgi:hypothetical protein
MTSQNTSESAVGVATNFDVWVLSPDGVEHESVHNVSCVGGHEAAAGFFATGTAPEPTDLALGVAGENGTSASDRSLNDEQGRTPLNTAEQNGTTATIRAYVPSLKQIGTSTDQVDELGVVLSDGDLLNHATITERDLSGTDTSLVVTVDLTFAAP